MENKLAIIGIVVNDKEDIKRLNEILSAHSEYIIGRTGIPRNDIGVNLISVFVEAPHDIISSLSGKLGMLKGISSKVVIAKKEA